MSRLTFRFTPLECVDFDVCAGPPRPAPPPAEPPVQVPAPARTAAAKKIPEPAEG